MCLGSGELALGLHLHLLERLGWERRCLGVGWGIRIKADCKGWMEERGQ
jgi:hypothetical protein